MWPSFTARLIISYTVMKNYAPGADKICRAVLETRYTDKTEAAPRIFRGNIPGQPLYIMQ